MVSPNTGCGLTATDTVCTEIINFGLDTLDNIIASFSVDGGAFTTPENVPGILLPGDTLVYCFTATADLSTFGTHEITVVTTQLVPADTVNMKQLKEHWYRCHDMINPSRVVPEGPAQQP